MWSEYEITYSDAESLRDPLLSSVPELKRQIGGLKQQIKALGNVNVNAIEDYKEISGRYEFMKTQHDDLVKAEETLLKIIEELDTGMRRQFEEKFKEIRREFDKVFKELFGGGHGHAGTDGGRGYPGSGHSDHCPAAGQEAAEHDAAVRRREGADGHRAAVCHPELKAVPVLPVWTRSRQRWTIPTWTVLRDIYTS